MRVCVFVALVICSLQCEAQAGQLCLSCTDAVEPRDCGQLAKCGIHETCYVEEFVNSFGSIRYNLGCRDVLQCSSGIPALDGKRSITNLLVCSECCSGDICNNAGCGSKGYASRDQRGPLCASCQSQEFDDDCNKIQQCGRDEACLSDVEQLQDILKQTGGKRDTTDVLENNGCIIRCCDGDLCNVNCSNSTTHPVQTSPSLDPQGTTPLPLLTTTQLIIIPTHKLHSTAIVNHTTAKQQSTHAHTTSQTTTLSSQSTQSSIFTTTHTLHGVLTTQQIDLCFSNPCIGGTCDMRNDTYVCLCYPGFQGQNCEAHVTSSTSTPTTNVIDYCVPNPCFSGNCSIYLNTYRCTCNYGYTGRNCSINYIAALSTPTSTSTTQFTSTSTTVTTVTTGLSTRLATSAELASTSNSSPPFVDWCLSNPCMAGTCSVLKNSFQCTCYPGYSGTQCSQAANVGSTTTTTTTKRPTTSTTKATTPAQTTTIVQDPCLSNPCMAGSCSVYFTTYHCSCFYGYWGSQCEKRWGAVNTDACSLQPCVHGNCTALNQTVFQCVCENGYTGMTCNENVTTTTTSTSTTNVIDYCVSNPCFSGNCSIYLNTYRCTCNYGYTGRNCSINYIAALSSPTTQLISTSSTVTSVSTRMSTRLSTSTEPASTLDTSPSVVDSCLSNPCMAGTCSVLKNSFNCTCYPGYSGTQCSQATNVGSTITRTTTTKKSTTSTTKATTSAQPTTIVQDPCLSNPCMAGSCSVYNTTYRCSCVYGYWGRQCEKRWGAVNTGVCSLQHCVHGNCTELNETAFQCVCENGYTGMTCNERLNVTTTSSYIDECSLNPCNKGNCTRIDNYTFTCSCPLGYTGRACNTKQDCPVLKIGDNVVRGPDWKWGTQDHQTIGKVISIPRKGWTMVSWGDNEVHNYRNGADNLCEVWFANATAALSMVTTNSNCDANIKLCKSLCSPYGYKLDLGACNFCLCNNAIPTV